MHVGLFLTTEFDGKADPARELEEMLDQVRAARDAGFQSIWVPHHYLSGPKIAQFQAIPMLARIAAEAPNTMLGTGVLILSMMNPVILAEDAAAIDWMCGGNLVLGVGIGYRDHEFAALGSPRSQRVGRFVEYIEAMRLLWTQERATYDGRYVKLNEDGISLRPKRPGGIPLYVAGTVEPAIRRAARLGDTWLSPGGLTQDEIRAGWRIFEDERRKFGLSLDCPRVLSGECYVGATNEQAVAEAGGPLMAKYERYASYGYEGVQDENDPRRQDFHSFSNGRFFVGDEAMVKDMLQNFQQEIGAQMFRMRMRWPGLGQKEVLKSIERLGRVAASI